MNSINSINRILGRHLNKCVCVYLDDIFIFSRTEEEHFQHLDMVLRLLREHKLFAKMKKCDFFKTELKYLGHLVSATGIKPDPAKIQTVPNWPQPRSVADVRQFLGLVNFFRKFIRVYAATAVPLTDLLKGLSAHERTTARKLQRFPKQTLDELAVSFAARWSEACAAAFNAIKTALVSAPVLALPDPSAHYTMAVGLVYISGKELRLGLSSGRPDKVITNLPGRPAPKTSRKNGSL